MHSMHVFRVYIYIYIYIDLAFFFDSDLSPVIRKTRIQYSTHSALHLSEAVEAVSIYMYATARYIEVIKVAPPKMLL